MHQPSDSSTPIGHILIADDDEDFRALLARRAHRMGMSIVETGDGALAIRAVRQQAFDALVLDLYMPGHSGLEIFAAARRTDPEVQAIVLTGNASVETAIEALRAGAYDYLTKPLDSLTDFELALTRALEHRYLRRENARLFAEVQRLAITDSLTGLFNRHKLGEALDAEVERAKRYGRPLSLIMLDLDNLKQINDSYGHQAGDDVLMDVARVIQSQIRKVDIPTRMGGDEFLVVLPEADLNEATAVATRILENGKEINYNGDAVTFSIGVTDLGPEISGPETFLYAVDATLYDAKRKGKGELSAGRAMVAPDAVGTSPLGVEGPSVSLKG